MLQKDAPAGVLDNGLVDSAAAGLGHGTAGKHGSQLLVQDFFRIGGCGRDFHPTPKTLNPREDTLLTRKVAWEVLVMERASANRFSEMLHGDPLEPLEPLISTIRKVSRT